MDDEDWEELQQRAAGTIRLCLADEVVYHVMNLTSSAEIWKKLESRFMSKTVTTKLYLKQRLYGLKMHEGHDLTQHVNVFNQLITDLIQLDVKIEDEDRAMILLCSLPPSYEHMVTTLTYGKETINVEEITMALLAHNQRKQYAGESSHADSLYVKGYQDRGRKSENEGSGRQNSRSNDGDMLSVSTTQLMDPWILDSGCSYHITPNREWFSTYMPVNSGSVYLGDDSCCNIVGIGEVRIRMYDGTVRTLCDVRHIPDLKKNLISLGTLHKNGFIPKADEDRETIRIVKGALVVMKGKITAGNIYKLLGSTVVGGANFVESCDDDTKLWHMRLGHLSESGMVALHKRNLLHGVKSCKLDFCKFCVLGKQTKVSFMTGKHKTGGILDYVHSDVWGPTRESSLGGSMYYVTFIDDFSKKVWVYLLKQKSEVFAKFKQWKAQVENQTGHHEHLWVVKLHKRSKLDAKSKKCIFLGYKKGVKGYKFWDPVAKKMVINRDAIFDEQSMLQQKQDKVLVDFEQCPGIPEKDVTVETCENSNSTSGGFNTIDLQNYSLARDRERRINVKASSRFGFEDMASFALHISSDDPVTFQGAITSQEKGKWMAAMVEEMESL
ncbi:hypothetical protein GQ457_04G008090 [Hibiscus cannabinus]